MKPRCTTYRRSARLATLALLCWAAPIACVNRGENGDALTEAAAGLLAANGTQLLMIGDSLTDFSSGFGLQARLGAEYAVNFRAIINTDFPFWTQRLDDAFAAAPAAPPTIILVPLGTNDGFTATPAQFLDRVADFHTAIRARSRARLYYFLMPQTAIGTLAPAIAANNAAFRTEHPNRYAADNSALIDLESVFLTASPVPPLYAGNDPLHPTETGYALIAIEIERAIRGSL